MGNQKVREKKKPTFFLAVLPILAMILLLGVGYAVMGLSPEVLMLVSAAVAAVIAIVKFLNKIQSLKCISDIILFLR